MQEFLEKRGTQVLRGGMLSFRFFETERHKKIIKSRLIRALKLERLGGEKKLEMVDGAVVAKSSHS